MQNVQRIIDENADRLGSGMYNNLCMAMKQLAEKSYTHVAVVMIYPTIRRYDEIEETKLIFRREEEVHSLHNVCICGDCDESSYEDKVRVWREKQNQIKRHGFARLGEDGSPYELYDHNLFEGIADQSNNNYIVDTFQHIIIKVEFITKEPKP